MNIINNLKPILGKVAKWTKLAVFTYLLSFYEMVDCCMRLCLLEVLGFLAVVFLMNLNLP